MKKYLIPLCLFILGAFVIGFWAPISSTLAEIDLPFIEREPDIPSMLQKSKNSISKEEFLEKRAEGFALKRGLNNGQTPDVEARQQAVEEMDRQQESLSRRAQSPERDFLMGNWSPIGPAPIIAGAARHSGRVISIAVHPTNPDIVYVGTAQGGLYRTTNGGTSWTPLMDNALSLAIGAIAISPSQPEVVYVGTGEPNFSSDSFFGVGVYRIENASTVATLVGPLNRDAAGADVFTGRAISEIIVHPTDHNTIFVGTTSGVGGIGGAANSVLPSRGIYRSTNAAGLAPTFGKLTGLAANGNFSVRDIAVDPTNPNVMVAGVVATGPTGGIYRTTDALAANPTFTQTFAYTGTSTSELTTEFAAVRPAGSQDATFYAASGNLGGRVLISTNGGANWTEQIDNNFCTPQCFYDIAIAVDPTNAARVYLGGSPSMIAGFSATSGTAFVEGGSGVHVDTHALTVAPSNPAIVYLGTDGGIYKSTNSGVNYTHLNTPQFFATQFMSVAVHPTDPNFTIGGTQDNGTNFYNPAGDSWTRVDGGDGGYAVIDQNAADTTNVRMYHTYFSQIASSSVVGYATRANTTAAWSFRGCNGTVPNNGINCNDTAVLFYAPLESGPGNPNTIYYGTDRLYRSDNAGTNHTVVSQAPIQSGVPISAIGISQQNDNIRIVGLSNGGLFGTNNGSSTLIDLDTSGQVTNGFISRAVIDPNNSSVAYVTLSNFGVANVFKTTNLNTGTPTWTNISAGIPQVPVSAFVVDPANSNVLYAGTDIGVYVSTNAGGSWAPFGVGLPRVAVFDMAITNGTPRKLRIATHGKGMYEISLVSEPTGTTVADFDGDGKTDMSVFRPNGGNWYVTNSSNNQFVPTQFGANGDIIVPGDYDGDAKTDRAVFRPSNGFWYILRSSDNQFTATQFGTNGDKPAAADFDGDDRTDLAVFRPTDGTWYLLRSTAGFTGVQFGNSSDTPVPADYDGDNKADIAVFRATNGSWYRVNSGNNQFVPIQFGQNGDVPVVGDYDNDEKADIAVFRPLVGDWYRLNSSNGVFVGLHFGSLGDIPAPGDFDGDGRTDQAVFRPTDGTWYLNRTTAGFTAAQFGSNGDVPVPSRQNP